MKKPRTTLVSPILRPEILHARREPGDHVLVYQTASANAENLISTLKKLPYQFSVYGAGRVGIDGNIDCRPFAEQGFIDDLRTARCVIAGGGLLGWIAGEIIVSDEVVHTNIPFDIHIQELVARPLLAAFVVVVGLVLAKRAKAKHHAPVDLAPEDKK